MTMNGRPGDQQQNELSVAGFMDADDRTVLDLSGASAPSLLGDNLGSGDFGDYILLQEVARGGMGVVFKARHKRLNRIVALKVILAGEYADKEDILRFQAEAESAAKLQHAGIVPIYEFGESEGRAFLSMGFIEGVTLASRVTDGPLEGRDAARLIVKVAEAIEYAHQQGVIHRDLKPGNILLDEKGAPYVTDFGLAKQAETDSQLTGTGQVIGTPSYMSPEQATGKNDAIGPLSDVYSLGAVLYCLLTGRPPFQAANMMDTLSQVVHQEPISPRQVNPTIERDLQTICLKCLEKDPSHRYESAEALRSDLQRYLNFEPIEATPISMTSRCWRWCRRNPVVASLVSVLAALVITLAIVGPLVAFQQSQLRSQSDQLVTEKLSLIDELTDSMSRTDAERTKAERMASALHDQLVEVYVDRGNREILSDNPINAVPWYAAALSQDVGDPEKEREHRFRLTAILSQAAKPEAIWPMSDETTLATVSPDGRLVAAAARDGSIVVWETSTNQFQFSRRWENTDSGAEVRSLKFSRDGKRLMALAGRRIKIWDLTTKELAIPAIRYPQRIVSADLDENGRILVSATWDGTVLVHNAETGDLIHSRSKVGLNMLQVGVHTGTRRIFARGMDGAKLFDLDSLDTIADLVHEGSVEWAEFDPRGMLLVTASADGSAKIWNASNGDLMTPPLLHPERVRVASFDSLGKRVATGSYDCAARVWDAETGELLSGPLMSENSIWRTNFSPDGKYLVTGSLDHTARLWNIDSGKEVSPPLRHGFLVSAAEFLPSGNQLLTASADRTVRIWSFQPRANLLAEIQHDGPVRTCRLSSDNQILLTASADGTASLWNINSPKSTRIILPHLSEVRTAEFSHDGRYVVTASHDKTANIWLSADGQQVTPPLQHDDIVWKAVFSPDDRKVLTICNDGYARLWEVESGILLHKLQHEPACIWGTFDHQGRQILTCSSDRTAKVWDAQTGVEISPPLQHARSVEGGGFSPDGLYVVTASLDHTAQIWEVASGKKTTPPLEHFAGVHNASFTPDGHFVLTGARDGSARLWNAHDGSPATPPMSIGHGLVRAIASPSGQLIATGGGTGAILWDPASGRLLAAGMEHDDWVLEVGFSQDSTLLTTASDDGKARIWKVPSPDQRPTQTLLDLAHLMSSHRADPANGLIPLTPEELQELLRKAK